MHAGSVSKQYKMEAVRQRHFLYSEGPTKQKAKRQATYLQPPAVFARRIFGSQKCDVSASKQKIMNEFKKTEHNSKKKLNYM